MIDTKVEFTKVLNNITLESSAAATQADASRILVDTFGKKKLTLSAIYTPGASETSNNGYLVVYGYDGFNWVQINSNTDTAGVITYTPLTYKIAAATAVATAAYFTADINFTQIKITAYEDGVAANKGTMTAVVLVQ